MTKLAMGASVPVETPSLPLQGSNHFPHFHDLRLRTPCDRLACRPPGAAFRTELSVAQVAEPSSRGLAVAADRVRYSRNAVELVNP